MTIGFAILTLLLQVATSAQSIEWGLPLKGASAEEFLENADVISARYFSAKARTQPKKVELSDGQRTYFAVFKSINEFAGKKRFADHRDESEPSDSYKYEIAAYELDKLLGLDIVPPTVERRIDGEDGSLCMWVEGAITEWERLTARDIHPPDTVGWNNQMYTVRLFLQLIYDSDYDNTGNLLITTEDWKLYKIDSSRAFRSHTTLLSEVPVERFSRSVLASLRDLNEEQLNTHLRRWLSRRQIHALWVRRGLILELAEHSIAEHGEETVLFD
jgi:hypothetical protein